MIINIKVIPKSKKNLVKEIKGGYKVYVTSPAEKGRANVDVINILSEYFDVKRYQINVISGQHNRNKVIELP